MSNTGEKHYYNMNLKPIKLINKARTNMWWNELIQLFSTTRDKLIVNEMDRFINEHKCDNENDKKCWNCNMFHTTIAIIIRRNNNSSLFTIYTFMKVSCLE
jgi:hypothetical protein